MMWDSSHQYRRESLIAVNLEDRAVFRHSRKSGNPGALGFSSCPLFKPGAGLYGAFGVKWFDVDRFGPPAEPRLMFPLISISLVCCGACAYVGEGEHFPAFLACSGSGESEDGRRILSSTYPHAVR